MDNHTHHEHEDDDLVDEPGSSLCVQVGLFGVLFYLLLWRIALRDFTIIGLTNQNTLSKCELEGELLIRVLCCTLASISLAPKTAVIEAK